MLEKREAYGSFIVQALSLTFKLTRVADQRIKDLGTAGNRQQDKSRRIAQQRATSASNVLLAGGPHMSSTVLVVRTVDSPGNVKVTVL